MACRVACDFKIKRGRHAGHYTGRHWWGKASHNGQRLEPVSGNAANRAAKKLGFAERGPGERGTSIMILDPIMDENPAVILNAIQRSLLWNFWPKLVKYPNKGTSMVFKTLLDGVQNKLPNPEDCPPLDLFVRAMQNLKDTGGIAIQCEKPQKYLGRLCIEKGPKGPRPKGFGPGDDGMFPEASCHVALMRPAELVVKYLEGNLLPPSAEWGGLFLCSDEEEVEHSFAMAEPPAHDDWVPKNMPKGWPKTYVNVALRRVKEEMEQAVAPTVLRPESGHAELAKLSGRMGSLLNGAIGDGLSPKRPAGGKGSPSRRKSLRITDLVGWGPALWDNGEILAWFNFKLESPDARQIVLSGQPKVFIDGELSDEAPDGTRPEIRIWTDENEEFLAEGETLSIKGNQTDLIWVGISIPDQSAISFVPEIVE
jgi:hypothetical protein